MHQACTIHVSIFNTYGFRGLEKGLFVAHLAEWPRNFDALNEVSFCQSGPTLDAYVFGLEILQNGANCSRSGCKSRVKSMDVCLLHIRLLLHAVSDLEVSALIVCAVAKKRP